VHSFTPIDGQLASNPFMHSGDSATADQRTMQKFLIELQRVSAVCAYLCVCVCVCVCVLISLRADRTLF
jgi:hypothetical protein